MDKASGIRHQVSGDEDVGAAIGRPPEADVAEESNAKTKKTVARWEALRRVMLVLASVLLIGGYAIDVLPVLYASAVPLIVALLATYRIKHLEERSDT